MTRTVRTAALSLTLSALLTGSLAFAQAPAGPPPQDEQHTRHHHHPNPQREAAHLSQRLNLSADQTSRLEPILAEREQKMQALRQSEGTISAQQMSEQRREIMKNTRQQLAGVLTPEQMQQMREMHHHGHGRWQGNGAQPGA